MGDETDKKLLEEDIRGVVPAVATWDRGFLQCVLVFTKEIIIVALFRSKIVQIAGAIRPPDYHIAKNSLDYYQHKPVASILSKYDGYIIPCSGIIKMETCRTGRIVRTSRLIIHTVKNSYMFCFSGVSLGQVEDDIRSFLPESLTLTRAENHNWQYGDYRYPY